MHVFRISVNIEEENFSEWLMIRQICQFFPLPKFSHVQYTVHGKYLAVENFGGLYR